MTLLERHVELFNQGVRSGDFAPMLVQFTDDAELVLEGVPAGPFRGKETIAAAYASTPPDDEVDVISSEQADDGTIVARYAWRADGGRPAGRMIFTPRGEQIARLVRDVRAQLGARDGFEPAWREHALALGASPDQRDLHLELSLDEVDVGARSGGQLVHRADVVEGLGPTCERLVDGRGMVEVALVRGEVAGLAAVA